MALTAVRAIAAWWVVLYHLDDEMPLPQPFAGILKHGAAAVDLFFIVSGFVLARRYTALFVGGVARTTYGWFVGLRLARIYPVHFTILILFLSLPIALNATGRALPPGLGVADFVRSLFLVQDWPAPGALDGVGALSWNGPAWSISAELLFYLLFPFIVPALERGLRSTTALVALPVLLLAAIAVKGSFVGSLTESQAQFGFFRCLTGSLLGMWLYAAVRRMPLGAGASLGLIVLSGGLLLLHWLIEAPLSWVVPASFLSLVSALLNPRHIISQALAHPVLLWLGRMSFSTYMVHYLIRDWLRLVLLDHAPFWLVVVVYAVLVAAASIVLHHWVEVPGRQAGRRWAARSFLPRQPPVVTTTTSP